MGKPKMWNISKTADDHRSLKWTKIWDSGYYSTVKVTFDAQFSELGFLCTGSSVQAEYQGPWASCYVTCEYVNVLNPSKRSHLMGIQEE